MHPNIYSEEYVTLHEKVLTVFGSKSSECVSRGIAKGIDTRAAKTIKKSLFSSIQRGLFLVNFSVCFHLAEESLMRFHY